MGIIQFIILILNKNSLKIMTFFCTPEPVFYQLRVSKPKHDLLEYL